MSDNHKLEQMNLLLPVGLSFIVFQSVTYLSDIYRGNVQVEKNIIRYGTFVAFFPTVLSGPIQKSRYLLPQIKNPNKFDEEQAKKGTILFVWGLFEKIMVANKLLVIVNIVFGDYLNYNSAYYIIAGIAFSLYIYADFSSYSDMARGISMIMGISIGKNFNNPYLSLSTSEFWNRWHISLNEWFIEEVYIPLGGNRKGVLRKYVNIFMVFLISGLWHGAYYHFIAWGCINGMLVIVGNILRPYKSRLYKKLNIDENVESIIFCKRAVAFGLITLTWIFFNNGINDSVYIVKEMILFSPIHFFDQNLFSIAGTLSATFVTVVASIVFCVVQYKRIDEREEYNKFARQPFMFQCLLIALLICICFFGVCSTDATVNTQFLYFQF
jgi:D-alanyl-lipoteichoic acid acyltransferase DltB (MBOAT superfamily)